MDHAEPIEADLDEALWKLHERARRDRYFGVVELHYQDGRVVRVRRQETLLPKDLLRMSAT